VSKSCQSRIFHSIYLHIKGRHRQI